MKNAIIILAVIALITVGIFLFLGGNTNQDGERVADKAPEFSFVDYDGNLVSSEYESRALTVVNSWASWCPFCVAELPDFAELQEEFAEEIAVIAIDRAESREQAKRFSDELGVTDRMTFLLDPNDDFYQSIGGFSMPETIFVNQDGEIVFHKRGPITFNEAREIVEDLLARSITKN